MVRTKNTTHSCNVYTYAMFRPRRMNDWTNKEKLCTVLRECVCVCVHPSANTLWRIDFICIHFQINITTAHTHTSSSASSSASPLLCLQVEIIKFRIAFYFICDFVRSARLETGLKVNKFCSDVRSTLMTIWIQCQWIVGIDVFQFKQISKIKKPCILLWWQRIWVMPPSPSPVSPTTITQKQQLAKRKTGPARDKTYVQLFVRYFSIL